MRYDGKMTFRCGRVTISGFHDAPNSGFDCALFVDGKKVSDQYTFLARPNDPKAVLSAVRGAISFAVEEGLDARLLEMEAGWRWKVERV